jgi:SAM-dependent methyltransferase
MGSSDPSSDRRHPTRVTIDTRSSRATERIGGMLSPREATGVGDVYEEADLYAAAFAWPIDAEVDWLLSEAGAPRTVLEPFCGNARYAPAFAARGVAYWGLDLSAAMLARAPSGPGIRLVQADVREFRLPARFDLAWCPVNSIRHLREEADVLSHLRCVGRHLAREGRYVVELELVDHEGPWTEPDPSSGIWSVPQPGGSVVHASWRRQSCDRATRSCVERATFRHEREGRVLETVVHDFAMRMWTYDDLVRIVSSAGFRIDRAFRHEGDLSRPPVVASKALENTGENAYWFLAPA